MDYSLEGTSNHFELQARGDGGFHLMAYFNGIATAGNPQGSSINLGWSHDGFVPFVLSGTVGNFWSTNPPSSSWMSALLPEIGSKPLRHIAMVGSHDAGMNTISGSTAFANAGNCQTQTKNIGQQLALGSRYFDMRPVIAGGKYVTGHYSDTHNSLLEWQGANGQSIESIISQLNQFTANNHELVIIKLSHSANTDHGRNYPKFDQQEWNGLLQKLLTVNHLHVTANPTSVDISKLSLSSFIGHGQAAVVFLIDAWDISLEEYANRGFYRFSQFPVFDDYSNTNDVNHMVSTQLQKLAQNHTTIDEPPFLLSWTLTQDSTDAFTQFFSKSKSLISFADEANNVLYSRLPPAIHAVNFPQIIYLDNIVDSNPASLAIAINQLYAVPSSSAPSKRTLRALKKRLAHVDY